MAAAPPQSPLFELAAVPAIFFILFWNVYAFGRFEPLDFGIQQMVWPFVTAGISALAAIVIFYRATVGKKKQLVERNMQALAAGAAVELASKRSSVGVFVLGLILLPGIGLLGGITIFCWCLTANSLLDSSPRQQVPVQVTEMIETTHSFLFREYSLKYRRIGETTDRSLLRPRPSISHALSRRRA